jgi:glycosyltransferase involved in cell wall biosynthesis
VEQNLFSRHYENEMRMSRTPRVIHTIPSLFGPSGTVGGAERYALELSRHMARRVPTTLVAFGDRAREERIGDLCVRVLGPARRIRGQEHNPFALGLIGEVLKADVVHCHQQHIVASSVAALVARAARKRVFVTDLGGGGWDLSSYVSTDRCYHGHLHISEYSRQIAGHDHKAWAHVIYGGVDSDKFRPAEGAREGRSILFVGRLLPHKGVNDIVEAATPDMRVELLGRPYHEQFTNDLKCLAAGKDVSFRHDTTDEELVRAYQQALCVVLPSVYRSPQYGAESLVPELLGQTLLEGMACGIPAICTAVASMPEVVVDGVTGFVVPPNDPRAIREKLRWLLDHPREAAAMGAAGRRRVLEKFQWATVVERCLAVYARAGSGRAASTASPPIESEPAPESGAGGDQGEGASLDDSHRP